MTKGILIPVGLKSLPLHLLPILIVIADEKPTA